MIAHRIGSRNHHFLVEASAGTIDVGYDHVLATFSLHYPRTGVAGVKMIFENLPVLDSLHRPHKLLSVLGFEKFDITLRQRFL